MMEAKLEKVAEKMDLTLLNRLLRLVRRARLLESFHFVILVKADCGPQYCGLHVFEKQRLD